MAKDECWSWKSADSANLSAQDLESSLPWKQLSAPSCGVIQIDARDKQKIYQLQTVLTERSIQTLELIIFTFQ